MSAHSNTTFSVMLFLALAALKLWSERRQRVPLAIRADVSTTASHR